MNSAHFIFRIRRTSQNLRHNLGDLHIFLVIINATWHNELTDDTKPPKRPWLKDQMQGWLKDHNIIFDPELKKAKLLEAVFSNLPKK